MCERDKPETSAVQVKFVIPSDTWSDAELQSRQSQFGVKMASNKKKKKTVLNKEPPCLDE